jgi:hypothetical protein
MSRSITPAPSGSLSPDFITVPSTTGFSAGDYVYQKNGDFGLPPASTFANFSVTPVSSIYGGTVGGTSTPVNYYGPDLTKVGGSSGECAAKLTDGNIVIVYANENVKPAFRIVDINNVQVVAEVQMAANSSLVSPAPISVVALTGGGFVAYWPDASSNKVAFAIYTNTGTLTTAYASDATFPTTVNTNQPLYGCALPNGGFALAVQGLALQNIYLRAFGATGVGAYTWVTVDIANAPYQGIGIAARSDNSVGIAWCRAATQILFSVYNSSGGGITSQALSITGAPRACSVVCLSDDTFVIGYRTTSATLSYAFRLLPIGNVLGAVVTVPVTSMIPGATVNLFLQLKELSSGGFVYFMNDGGYGMYYMFYTSAGVAVYPAPIPFPQIIYNYPYPRVGIVEISGYVSIYHGGTLDPSLTTVQVTGMNNSKISLTAYNLLSSVSTTSPVGTVSSSAGAYARSTSLPMKAAYLATNTETLGLNQVMSTGNNYTLAPGAVDSGAVDGIKSTTLPDGRFAIVYKNASTGAVSFNVYSLTGILQTTVSVGTGSTGAAARVRIAALASGKIVVGYQTLGAASVTLSLYSSSYGLIATTILSTDASPRFDLIGLPNDRFAIVYTSTAANPSYNVYDNTATLIFPQAGFSGDTGVTTISAATGPDGIFLISWVYSSGARISGVYQTGVNNYPVWLSPITLGAASNTSIPCQVAMNSANVAVHMAANSATTLQLYTLGTNLTASFPISNNSANMSTSWSQGNGAVGTTGAGTFLFFGANNANGNLYGFTGTNSVNSNSAYPYGLLSGITTSSSYGMQACITPSYGYNAVIAWINSGNIGQFAIVNAYPFNASQDITAGVTGSAPTTPLNISQSSGYYLAGVAVSDCPPGGTGQIQTNGVANLNSEYSTTTAFQGFDFQNPVTVGVKGTAAGRTVTMIKD